MIPSNDIIKGNHTSKLIIETDNRINHITFWWADPDCLLSDEQIYLDVYQICKHLPNDPEVDSTATLSNGVHVELSSSNVTKNVTDATKRHTNCNLWLFNVWRIHAMLTSFIGSPIFMTLDEKQATFSRISSNLKLQIMQKYNARNAQ